MWRAAITSTTVDMPTTSAAERAQHQRPPPGSRSWVRRGPRRTLCASDTPRRVSRGRASRRRGRRRSPSRGNAVPSRRDLAAQGIDAGQVHVIASPASVADALAFGPHAAGGVGEHEGGGAQPGREAHRKHHLPRVRRPDRSAGGRGNTRPVACGRGASTSTLERMAGHGVHRKGRSAPGAPGGATGVPRSTASPDPETTAAARSRPAARVPGLDGGGSSVCSTKMGMVGAADVPSVALWPFLRRLSSGGVACRFRQADTMSELDDQIQNRRAKRERAARGGSRDLSHAGSITTSSRPRCTAHGARSAEDLEPRGRRLTVPGRITLVSASTARARSRISTTGAPSSSFSCAATAWRRRRRDARGPRPRRSGERPRHADAHAHRRALGQGGD